MITRNTRKNDEEKSENDRDVDKALEDAGFHETFGMSPEEKADILKVLQMSNVEIKTQRLSLDSKSSDCQKTPDPHVGGDFQKASSSQCPQDVVEPQLNRSLQTLYPARGEENPSKLTRNTPGSFGRGLPERGRGRAIPKVKYNPLTLSSPGQRSNTSQHLSPGGPSRFTSSSQRQSSRSPDRFGSSSLQECPLSPQDITSGDEAISDYKQSSQSIVQSPQNEGSSTDHLGSPHHSDSGPDIVRSESSEVSQGPLSPEDCKMGVTDDNLKDVESEAVDVESDSLAEEGKGSNSGICGEKPISPASVEDAADEDEKEALEVKLVGITKCSVSPLQSLTRPCAILTSSKFFEELEKYKGNETEWMVHAKELAQAWRYALLDKILAENPIWGPPILDGGYNKQTLFKQSIPKYSSKLLGNSSDKQGAAAIRTSDRTAAIKTGDRAAKTQANAKLQGIMNEANSTEPDFPGTRQRSRQRDEEWVAEPQQFNSLRQKPKQAKSYDPPEGKKIQQSNAWTSKKRHDGSKDEVECLDASAHAGDNENWQSEREQKRRPGDSDSEPSPEPPAPSGSHDVFEFDEYGEHDNWEKSGTKSKRNSKRGVQSLQADVEVQAKPRARGGLSLRGKNQKDRIAKGAIAPPSEHATSAKKHLGNRGGPSGHSDGIVSQNNVNTENKWINSKDTRNSSNISAPSFYGANTNKVIQPRTPQTSQALKAPGENQRQIDFPRSPNSSGSRFGLDPDDTNDAAVAAPTAVCPICYKTFAAAKIEEHCSGCFEFSAEGEELPDILKDRARTDGTVTEDLEDAEFSPPIEATPSIQCKKCKAYLHPNSMSLHQEECDDEGSSQTGLKRASSIEDSGPAKKASRLMD